MFDYSVNTTRHGNVAIKLLKQKLGANPKVYIANNTTNKKTKPVRRNCSECLPWVSVLYLLIVSGDLLARSVLLTFEKYRQ